MERQLMDDCSGIQHIGIPTDCMEATVQFYEELGFQCAFKTVIREKQNVVFMKFNDIVLELYEEDDTVKRAGAIDHFTINCTDVERAYKTACDRHYKVVSEGIEELPFWENGIRFFIIEGPNHERIEIDQRM